jgi:hypothetical protein
VFTISGHLLKPHGQSHVCCYLNWKVERRRERQTSICSSFPAAHSLRPLTPLAFHNLPAMVYLTKHSVDASRYRYTKHAPTYI